MTSIPNSDAMYHYADEALTKGAPVLARVTVARRTNWDGIKPVYKDVEITVRAIINQLPDDDDVDTGDLSEESLQSVWLDYMAEDGDWEEGECIRQACLIRCAELREWKDVIAHADYNAWDYVQAAARCIRAQGPAPNDALDNIAYMLEKPWKYVREAWLGGAKGIDKCEGISRAEQKAQAAR